MVNNEPNKKTKKTIHEKQRKPYMRINYDHFCLFRSVWSPNEPKIINSYDKFSASFDPLIDLMLSRARAIILPQQHDR